MLNSQSDLPSPGPHYAPAKWFGIYLVFMGCFLLFCGIATDWLTPDENEMGDFLINYSGGFVRRGLAGQIALDLGKFLHVSPETLIFSFQLLCYVVIFWSLWKLMQNLVWSLWTVLLLYSPTVLNFVVYHPAHGYHKEILHFALLGSFLVLAAKRMRSTAGMWLFLALSETVLTFVHEAMFLFFPYLVAAFLIYSKSTYRYFLAAALFVLPLIGFVIVSRHPGNLAQAVAICQSVGGGTDLKTGICSGAIEYLSHTQAEAHLHALTFVHYVRPVFTYPMIIVLSLLPVVMALRALWHDMRRECVIFIVCSLMSWAASSVLFYYAVDWDRWIYIHAMSSAFLLVAIERLRQKKVPVVARPIFPQAGARRYIVIALSVLYIFGWQPVLYHHFPLPDEQLAVYLLRVFHVKVHGRTLG